MAYLPYSWLTFGTAKTQLSQRLADPAQMKWTNAEVGLYIQESLRMWNALTATWRAEFSFNPSTNWNSAGLLAGSPRLRTVTDTQCYTLMEYALSEPPTGGVWTGTSQFSISDLAGALARRRNEIIQVSNCNQGIFTLNGTPNVRRYPLPDTTIEPQRIRFLPADSATYSPITLMRADQVGDEFFEDDTLQQTPSFPSEWSVASEPPLSFDVDVAASLAGRYEVIALQSGVTFSPPSANFLNIPDDWAWLARTGALADLLGRESDATDLPRAQWCQKRYEDGLKLIAQCPWVFLANVDGVACDVSAMTAEDAFDPEWDSNAETEPKVVTAGLDLFWSPLGGSVGMTMVGNVPIPSADGDFIQVSRAVWDSVLSMAQFMAAFKMGGAEFSGALSLEAIFITAAEQEGKRIAKLGAYTDILGTRSQAEVRMQERW